MQRSPTRGAENEAFLGTRTWRPTRMQSPTTRKTLSARNLDDILLRCLSYALDTLRGLGTTTRERHTLHSTTPFRCISAGHQLSRLRLRRDAAQSPRPPRDHESIHLQATAHFQQISGNTSERTAWASRSEGLHSASVPRDRRSGVGADLADLARGTARTANRAWSGWVSAGLSVESTIVRFSDRSGGARGKLPPGSRIPAGLGASAEEKARKGWGEKRGRWGRKGRDSRCVFRSIYSSAYQIFVRYRVNTKISLECFFPSFI
jgi:hypothetical protein